MSRTVPRKPYKALRIALCTFSQGNLFLTYHFSSQRFPAMPSVPRPHENGTVETNGLRGVNQNNRRNRISGQGSSVPIPKTTPINGTVLNGIIPSGHVASRPTSDQHAGASATSIAITTSTVQAVTSLRPSEISALNSEPEHLYTLLVSANMVSEYRFVRASHASSFDSLELHGGSYWRLCRGRKQRRRLTGTGRYWSDMPR
jgi:hypothetical protein